MEVKRIFDFLNNLKENNNKDWFEANRKEYEAIRRDVEGFVKFILDEFTPLESGIGGLKVKDCMFRINRDIRFSPDKSPYKSNIGIVFSIDGKNSGKPSYYLHFQPKDNSFLAGGLWMPPPDALSKIRQEIDYNTEDFKNILNNKNFKKFHLGIDSEKLKTAPKGYPKDHPEIELLKHKHYVVTRALTDKEMVGENLKDLVLEGFKAIKPFNDFLTIAIS